MGELSQEGFGFKWLQQRWYIVESVGTLPSLPLFSSSALSTSIRLCILREWKKSTLHTNIGEEKKGSDIKPRGRKKADTDWLVNSPKCDSLFNTAWICPEEERSSGCRFALQGWVSQIHCRGTCIVFRFCYTLLTAFFIYVGFSGTCFPSLSSLLCHKMHPVHTSVNISRNWWRWETLVQRILPVVCIKRDDLFELLIWTLMYGKEKRHVKWKSNTLFSSSSAIFLTSQCTASGSLRQSSSPSF